MEKYKNLENYLDIKFIYDNNKIVNEFINNNKSNTIITNLNYFITYFKNDFNIEKYELRFIITCFFEYDYFKQNLTKKINNNTYKKIIVRKVFETLTDVSNESDVIKLKIMLCGFNLNKYNKNIKHNYEIIKKLIYNKKINCNYCYLFDNIKYFNIDKNKKENYLMFLSLILDDYLSAIITNNLEY